MKKKNRLLLILLAALLLCCALYGLLRFLDARKAEKAEGSAQSSVIYLSQIEEANSLTYSNSSGVFSFTSDGSRWVYDSDPDFPLSQSDLSLIAVSMKNLTALRQLEGGEDLSAYGLDSPASYVSAKNAAGDEVTVLIGSMASDGSYYAMRGGEEAIYTISASLPQQLKDVYALYALPAIVTVGATFDALELEGTLAGAPRTLSGLAEDMSDAVKALRTAWLDLAFDSLYAYRPDGAKLAECGLDAPALSLGVSYSDGSSALLLLGAQNENGDYYARLGQDGDICLLPESQATALLDALAAL